VGGTTPRDAVLARSTSTLERRRGERGVGNEVSVTSNGAAPLSAGGTAAKESSSGRGLALPQSPRRRDGVRGGKRPWAARWQRPDHAPRGRGDSPDARLGGALPSRASQRPAAPSERCQGPGVGPGDLQRARDGNPRPLHRPPHRKYASKPRSPADGGRVVRRGTGKASGPPRGASGDPLHVQLQLPLSDGVLPPGA